MKNTITSGHHKLPLLATRPPHREENFNWSGILKIHLKDSVEKHFNWSGILKIHLKDSVEKQVINNFIRSFSSNLDFYAFLLVSLSFS